MQKIDLRKNKLPLTLALMVCFLVITLTFNSRNSSVPANAGADGAGKRTVVLDAGHGGIDGGCVGIGGIIEKDVNLAIVKNLQQLLEFSGFNVVLTRSADESIHNEGVEGIRNQKVSDMQNRKAIVDAYPDSLFFSIHQNQFTEPVYFGGQMFYTTKHRDNFRLAQILQAGFSELQEGNDREIKLIDNNLFLFKSTIQPAVLIECGFLSNPNDAANLSSADYQKKVAFTVYKGIMTYLDEKGENGAKEPNSGGTETQGLYMQ